MGYYISAEGDVRITPIKWKVENEHKPFDTFKATLENHGFEFDIDDEGAVVGLSFYGKRWSDVEDLLWKDFPRYVDSDTYLEVRGEDPNDHYRYRYKNGEVWIQVPSITWEPTEKPEYDNA